MMYYNHNVHFESAAAAMAGRHAVAKQSAQVLFDDVMPGVAEMAMLEGFLLQPTVVALRFHQWDEIRKMPDPGSKLPLLRAAWLYARAMAAAAAGRCEESGDAARAYAVARDALGSAVTVGSPQNSAAGVLRGRHERPRCAHRAGARRPQGRDRGLEEGGRRGGRARLRRARDLVLPDAGVPRRGAPARRPGGGGGEGLPRGPRAATRAAAARSTGSRRPSRRSRRPPTPRGRGRSSRRRGRTPTRRCGWRTCNAFSSFRAKRGIPLAPPRGSERDPSGLRPSG